MQGSGRGAVVSTGRSSNWRCESRDALRLQLSWGGGGAACLAVAPRQSEHATHHTPCPATPRASPRSAKLRILAVLQSSLFDYIIILNIILPPSRTRTQHGKHQLRIFDARCSSLDDFCCDSWTA